MEPLEVTRKAAILAGVEAHGPDVSSIDIHGLWECYGPLQEEITDRIDNEWYELHVGTDLGRGTYSVMAAAEVTTVANLPVSIVVRVVPEGRYLHFQHRMGDGGFGEAFERIEKWIKGNKVTTEDFSIQHYTDGFDPSNPDSVLHVYVPVTE
jgi:predicted transcriptional regulator YdeE